MGKATLPGDSLHVDVAGPVMPMGVGQAKSIFVTVDELGHSFDALRLGVSYAGKGPDGAAADTSDSTHQYPEPAIRGTRGAPSTIGSWW